MYRSDRKWDSEKSLHRVTTKEKFLISELEKSRKFPRNGVAEADAKESESSREVGARGDENVRERDSVLRRRTGKKSQRGARVR